MDPELGVFPLSKRGLKIADGRCRAVAEILQVLIDQDFFKFGGQSLEVQGDLSDASSVVIEGTD